MSGQKLSSSQRRFYGAVIEVPAAPFLKIICYGNKSIMKHDWDNYTSLEEDVCLKCGLKKKTTANLRDIRGLINVPFTKYFIDGKWVDVNNAPKDIKKCNPK